VLLLLAPQRLHHTGDVAHHDPAVSVVNNHTLRDVAAGLSHEEATHTRVIPDLAVDDGAAIVEATQETGELGLSDGHTVLDPGLGAALAKEPDATTADKTTSENGLHLRP
jgi:hypothetical protein